MSEMVERIALAIFRSRYPETEHLAYWPDRLDELVNGPPFAADGYRAMARAAIEAMREPTKEMISAIGVHYGFGLALDYRRMIGAALDKVDA